MQLVAQLRVNMNKASRKIHTAAVLRPCRRRLQVPRKAQQDTAPAAAEPARAALLAVNPRALKGDDELRRIFGSRVVDAGDRDDDAGAVPGTRLFEMASALAKPDTSIAHCQSFALENSLCG